MKKAANFLLGSILGAFVGSLVVLLFAPESGSITREALSTRLNNFFNEIGSAMEERRSELEKEIEAYRE